MTDKLILIVAILWMLTLIGASFISYGKGVNHERLKWEVKQNEEKAIISQKSAEAERETTQVLTKYVDRVNYIKVKGDTIVKEVIKYVDKEVNSACLLSDDVRVLHNKAAGGSQSFSKASREVDDITELLDEN